MGGRGRLCKGDGPYHEPLASGLHYFWVPCMLLVYWGLMHRHVERLHETYQASADLSYQNERLIQSLREQTRAAQEAARFKDRFLASAAHDLKPVSYTHLTLPTSDLA